MTYSEMWHRLVRLDELFSDMDKIRESSNGNSKIGTHKNGNSTLFEILGLNYLI